MREETGAAVYGHLVGRRLSFSLGRYATVFQAEIYVACPRSLCSRLEEE